MVKKFLGMKRFVAVLASAILAASIFSSAVFAAPSKTDYIEVISAVDANGDEPDITVWSESNLDDEAYADNELRIMTQEEAIASAPMEGSDEMKATILSQPVITAEEGVSYPVKLTFAVPGIKEGDNVVMFECTFPSNTAFTSLQRLMVRGAMGIKITTQSSATWKALPTEVMDGKIEVTFDHIQNSLEASYPIVLYTDVNGNGGDGNDDTPKTGDINWAMPAAIIAVVAAAGIVVIVLTGRRRKAK